MTYWVRFCFILGLAGVGLLPATAESLETADLVDGLQPIAYRVGNWTAVVEWLDADGKVVRSLPSLREVRPVLSGQALQEQGRLFGMPVEMIMLVFYDSDADRITEVGVRTPGKFDRLHATVEPDQVTFTSDPILQHGQPVIFRAIDTNFQGDRYDTTGWVSSDDGATWRQTFRQVNHRVTGERCPGFRLR